VLSPLRSILNVLLMKEVQRRGSAAAEVAVRELAQCRIHGRKRVAERLLCNSVKARRRDAVAPTSLPLAVVAGV
jgi:hypothetical protein